MDSKGRKEFRQLPPGHVAQLVEQATLNRLVVGSIPTVLIMTPITDRVSCF